MNKGAYARARAHTHKMLPLSNGLHRGAETISNRVSCQGTGHVRWLVGDIHWPLGFQIFLLSGELFLLVTSLCKHRERVATKLLRFQPGRESRAQCSGSWPTATFPAIRRLSGSPTGMHTGPLGRLGTGRAPHWLVGSECSSPT